MTDNRIESMHHPRPTLLVLDNHPCSNHRFMADFPDHATGGQLPDTIPLVHVDDQRDGNELVVNIGELYTFDNHPCRYLLVGYNTKMDQGHLHVVEEGQPH